MAVSMANRKKKLILPKIESPPPGAEIHHKFKQGDKKPLEDMESLREDTRSKNRAKLDHEMKVEKDIERRRQGVRLKEKANYKVAARETTQHTDMTFWLTRVGNPPKRGVPEEKKGIRYRFHELLDHYEMNRFRHHALENFIYWPKLND